MANSRSRAPGGDFLAWRTQKSKKLLAFLWVNNWFSKNKSVSRASIIENVFPDRDADKALTLLHTTVYQLRKNLGKYGYAEGITYQNDGYSLHLPVEADVDALNRFLRLQDKKGDVARKILLIYKGNFLEEEEYLWAVGLQQKCKERVISFLIRFALGRLEDNNFVPPLKACLDRLYDLEPFDEEIAKLIIKYYGLQKNRNKLNSFFKDYERNLWKEMGLRPLEDAVRMYGEYMSGYADN